MLIMHLRELNEDIQSLSRGVFPQSIISDRQIKKAGKRISKILRKQYPGFSLLHPEPNYFHQHGSFMAYRGNGSDIWITLKFLVGPQSVNSKLYRIDVYPVPITNGSTHATQITGLPEYVVIKSTLDDQVKYATLTQAQLYECKVKGSITCEFGLKFKSIGDGSCVAA